MRWQSGRRSTNVEDRRGSSGGGGGLPRPGRRGVAIGGGGVIVIALLALVLSGGDTRVVEDVLRQLPAEQGGGVSLDPTASGSGPATTPTSRPADEMGDFMSAVLADTEDTWAALFERSGLRYEPPRLVLFEGSVSSACGFQDAAVGPFYCPRDRKAYLDLAFFDDLHARYGAPGDFAQAYVLAHEIGHHVQALLGLPRGDERFTAHDGRSLREEASVRQELQADCFAGAWAHHAHRQRRMLEPGDLEEGLAAASAIGDDRLQMQGRGHVTPESWTHGSSEQRVRWFRRGFDTGDPEECDTFAVASP